MLHGGGERSISYEVSQLLVNLLDLCAGRVAYPIDEPESVEAKSAVKRTRALTSEQVRNDIQLIAALDPAKDKRTARSRAILTFSALVGAMALARAVSDEALSREILKTVAQLLKNADFGKSFPQRPQR
jgi:hypothetical protein